MTQKKMFLMYVEVIKFSHQSMMDETIQKLRKLRTLQITVKNIGIDVNGFS